MKTRFVLALAVSILIGLPWAGLCGETPAALERKGESCRMIAAIVSVYPTLEVWKSEVSVRDAENGSESPGCRVYAAGPTALIAGEVPPEVAVRQLLEQGGWNEDPNFSADGAGTTSFALRHGGILCLVNAGAPSGFEDGELFTDEIYEFDAMCVAETER